MYGETGPGNISSSIIDGGHGFTMNAVIEKAGIMRPATTFGQKQDDL
jgi:hypothetical protein